MNRVTIAAGANIYREGDASDRVYFVHSGTIEVLRGSGGAEVLLGGLGGGQMFGEMGIIRNKPRSTTTRARDEVELTVLEAADFLRAFGGDNPLPLAVLRMLCERLALADEKLAGHYTGEGVRFDEAAAVRLLPDSPWMKTQIGSDGVTITRLPFRIGRQTDPDRPSTATADGLLLHSDDDLHLSVDHFEIAERDGRIAIVDLESYLGTTVNGRRVSSYDDSAEIRLRPGGNGVVAGGAESLFRFEVVIEMPKPDGD